MKTRLLYKLLVGAVAVISFSCGLHACDWAGGSVDGAQPPVIGSEQVLPVDSSEERVPLIEPPSNLDREDPQREMVPVEMQTVFDPGDKPSDLALSHVDDEPMEHLLIARHWIEKGDLDLARVELAKALFDNPRQVEAAVLLGTISRGEKNLDLGKKALLLATQLDPKQLTPWILLARIALQEKELNQAETYIQKALAVDSKQAEPYSLQGRIWLERSNWHKAILNFQKAVKLGPDNLFYRNNLGLTYIMKKDFGKAIEILESAVKDREDVPAFVRNNLGLAYEGIGRLQEAIVEFRAVVESHPGYIKSQINLDRLSRLAQQSELKPGLRSGLTSGAAQSNEQANPPEQDEATGKDEVFIDLNGP